MAKEAWLNCTISEGQFAGEVAVSGETFDGTDFSLFCPEEFVNTDRDLAIGKPVRGTVMVSVIDERDDLVLIGLPKPTLENGPTITVKRQDLSFRQLHQRA